MANLYEINAEILNCVDIETGEIIDELALEALEMDKAEKIENIALWIKNLKAQAAALKAEKDSFAAREKTANNKIKNLQNYLLGALRGQKFESTKVKIFYGSNDSVEIADGAKIPEEFLKPAEPTIDKAGLKTAIKAGRVIPGVRVVSKNYIKMK